MSHFQATENGRLEAALRASVPSPLIPSSKPLAPTPRKSGDPIGRIEIPRLKLSSIVLEGSDDDALSLGVGRVSETSEPGAAGNVVLGGHRDTVFRPLKDIRKGDRIKIVTPQASYQYTVDWTKVVDPGNTEVLQATAHPSLTLVTCYPFYYVGSAPHRFIVRAHQEVEPDPVTTVVSVPVSLSGTAAPRVRKTSASRRYPRRTPHIATVSRPAEPAQRSRVSRIWHRITRSNR